jgi:hypothetical protein
VLYGDGAGNFPRRTETGFGEAPRIAALGDLTGDGRPDLVVPDIVLFTYLNDGTGNLSGGSSYPLRSVAARIADLTGDGRPDVASVNNATRALSVLYGTGRGDLTLSPGSPYALGHAPRHLAVGDLNGDGRPDIVTANGDGSVSVLLNGPPF